MIVQAWRALLSSRHKYLIICGHLQVGIHSQLKLSLVQIKSIMNYSNLFFYLCSILNPWSCSFPQKCLSQKPWMLLYSFFSHTSHPTTPILYILSCYLLKFSNSASGSSLFQAESWWLRFQEYQPATSPPTRGMLHTLKPSSQILLIRSSLKPTRKFESFEHEPPILPAWPLQ